MDLKTMKTLLDVYIDDVSDIASAVIMFNAAKNKMAAEIHCEFPDIVQNGALDDSFAFDAKYHEIPVLYAAAMFKSADSSVSEKGSYLSQFEDALQSFTENYDPPVYFLAGQDVQQFVATDGQTDYEITQNEFSPRWSNLQVYLNGSLMQYRLNGCMFTLYNRDGTEPTIVAGDKVTAKWDLHSEWTERPFNFPSRW